MNAADMSIEVIGKDTVKIFSRHCAVCFSNRRFAGARWTESNTRSLNMSLEALHVKKSHVTGV